MSNEFVYHIDSQDRIAFVNHAYDRFSKNERDLHLSASEVLGRSLWEFVIDPPTRAIYREAIRRTREGRKVAFTIRCDIPGVRNRLEARLVLLQANRVAFHIKTLNFGQRFLARLLDPLRRRGEGLVRVCSWCKRMAVASNRWVENDQALRDLGLIHGQALPQVTHGICPTCLESNMRHVGKVPATGPAAAR